jgi:hypothetical protein
MSNDYEFARLKEELISLQRELSSLKQDALNKTVACRESLNSEDERLDAIDKRTNVYKRLADIPGMRTPAWYRVNVDFAHGDMQSKFGQTQISPIGPFICTQIQCYYQVTDKVSADYFKFATSVTSNAAGRTLPSASMWPLVGRLTYTVSTLVFADDYIGNIYGLFGANGYPDFNIQIEIAGSNRKWTGNHQVPAAAFYGYLNPLYAGFEGVVENTDSIVVHAMPSSADGIYAAGTFVAEFHGYHINAHVKVKDLMGY